MLKKNRKKGSFGKKGVFGKKYPKAVEKQDVDIILCIPGKNYSSTWGAQWDALLEGLQQNSIKYMISRQYNPNIYVVRNACLGGNNKKNKHQELFNGKINYKFIYWADSDNPPNLEVLKRLVNHNKDIVGGLYKMQDNTNYATVEKIDWDYYMENKSQFEFLTDKKIIEYRKQKKALLPVAFTGTGCMVVKKGVFEKIGYPWFNPEHFSVPGTDIIDFMGDDMSFCVQAKKLGIQTYVDLSVRVGHEKTMIL